jgi:uncharacterized protein (DUF885 family)
VPDLPVPDTLSRLSPAKLSRAATRRAQAAAVLLALAIGCAHPPGHPTAATGTGLSIAPAVGAGAARVPELARIFDDYYEESLALDPVTATTLGDHRYDDRMANDISEAFRARLGEMAHRFLTRLAAISPAGLTGEDRLDHELLRRELSDRLEGLTFPDHLLALTHISGQPVDFPIMGSGGGVHPFETAADYDHFLRRMDDFVAWVDTAIANLRRGIALGIVHPRLVIEKLLPQLDAQVVVNPEESIFFAPLRHFPPAVGAADRARLELAYRSKIGQLLVPTYRRLRTFLAEDYLSHCRTTVAIESLPNGVAYYAYRVRTSTTTRQTPDQIFQVGETEVARIEGELEKVRLRAGFKGDLHAFARALASAPGGATTREGLIASYEDLRSRVWGALPSLFGRLPRAPFQIRPIEAFREDSAPSQYQQSSPDGSRPGVFFVNAGDIAKGKSMRVSETLFLHEAVPGHHMQIALQYENTNLPKFHRLLGYTAFVEGWALYAESLGPELGLFRDPTQQIEHLGAEMLRAVRLVVDTGLHHRGWSRDKAIDYYKRHVLSTSEDVAAGAELEIDRYIAWPAQALAYKTGQLELAALRARAARKLGAAFDVRAFHDQILLDGPLPLDILETQIDNWATSRGTGAAPSSQ